MLGSKDLYREITNDEKRCDQKKWSFVHGSCSNDEHRDLLHTHSGFQGEGRKPVHAINTSKEMMMPPQQSLNPNEPFRASSFKCYKKKVIAMASQRNRGSHRAKHHLMNINIKRKTKRMNKSIENFLASPSSSYSLSLWSSLSSLSPSVSLPLPFQSLESLDNDKSVLKATRTHLR